MNVDDIVYIYNITHAHARTHTPKPNQRVCIDSESRPGSRVPFPRTGISAYTVCACARVNASLLPRVIQDDPRVNVDYDNVLNVNTRPRFKRSLLFSNGSIRLS